MSKKIDSVIQSYLDNREISGGAMIVRKGGQIVYQNKWGWADIAAQTPIDDTAIFRMMSMTKPVTAVGILMLMEKGLLRLDDPISRFLPQFSNMQVSCDKRYVYTQDAGSPRRDRSARRSNMSENSTGTCTQRFS